MSVVGVGDRAALGATHLAHEGLLEARDHERAGRLAGPRPARRRGQDRGVHAAAGRALATHARHGGGAPGAADRRPGFTRSSIRASRVRGRARARRPDFVEVVELAGEEWLLFKPVPVNVAFLRGTTADEDGNVTMEEEAVLGEMLAMAQATRRAGGIVVVQVKRMARRGTLPAKQVKIPGILVDFVVVDPDQRQTYATLLRSQLLGRAAHSGRRHQAPAVRPAQGDRPPRGDGALPRRDLQSGRRRVDGPVDDRRRGGPARRRVS